MTLLKIAARGEVFKILQVVGNLFVCAEENGGCCCGHAEKGRALVNKELYAQHWEDHGLRNKVHLTFVGCLGPCPIGNNAMLTIHGRAIWFKDLNDDRFIPMIYDYVDAMLAAGQVLSPTGELAEHVYERYLPAPTGDNITLVPVSTEAASSKEDFDGLDPVCMMTVDPATAQWQSVYNGQTYYFCAPSCKRSFDKAPATYVKSAARSALSVSFEITNGDLNMSNQTNQTNQTDQTHHSLTESKTFTVPNISCEHCVRSIKNEVSEIAGVTSVQADDKTKIVSVTWDNPATWEQIKATLTEIEYPPQELIH